MFRAGLLLIIRRYYSVYTTVGICYAFRLAVDKILQTASQRKHITHTNCCIYTVVPPDGEQ